MIQPYKITSNKSSNVLEIAWDPSNVCNFKCRYCFYGSNHATHRNPDDIDLIVDNFRHLMDHYKKIGKDKFHFFIAGGEPTLWKDLGVFIKKIKMYHNVYISIITNGSRTLRWWREYAHAIDDAHITHHIDQGDVEHIIKVADILHEHGSKTTVKVLMDPAKWDQGISDIKFMKKYSKHPWFIMTAQVLEPEQINSNSLINDVSYTEDQLKFIKKELKRIPGLKWFWKNRHLLKEHIRLWESRAYLDNNTRIKSQSGTYFSKGWNNFKGWSCSIGVERVYVHWTGNITGSCQSKLFGLNFYYNILDRKFKEKFNPNITTTICPNSGCWCMPETHVSKEKIIEIKSVSISEYPLHRYTNL